MAKPVIDPKPAHRRPPPAFEQPRVIRLFAAATLAEVSDGAHRVLAALAQATDGAERSATLQTAQLAHMALLSRRQVSAATTELAAAGLIEKSRPARVADGLVYSLTPPRMTPAEEALAEAYARQVTAPDPALMALLQRRETAE